MTNDIILVRFADFFVQIGGFVTNFGDGLRFTIVGVVVLVWRLLILLFLWLGLVDLVFLLHGPSKGRGREERREERKQRESESGSPSEQGLEQEWTTTKLHLS